MPIQYSYCTLALTYEISLGVKGHTLDVVGLLKLPADQYLSETNIK